MGYFKDEYMADAEMMPLVTGGELRMWNLNLPGIDVAKLEEDQWVLMAWRQAYLFAVRFLDQIGMSWEAIQKTLSLPEGVTNQDVPEVLSLQTRHRLYDVHRMRIAIMILYPNQADHQKSWFTSRQHNLNGRTPLEIIVSEGTDKIRKLLEGRLNA